MNLSITDPMPQFEQKICTREELKRRVAALPKPVVLTNGVFDILHRGHVTYLAQARELGASLVVAANTDASVKRLGKGDQGAVALSSASPAEFAAFMVAETEKFGKVVRAVGAKGE